MIIRSAQLKILEQHGLKRFEDEMVAHSKEFSPKLCEILGDDQVRLAVRQAILRAADHRLANRGSIRLFVEMMFLFGSSFDTDPQYHWAGEILHRPEPEQIRAELLYTKILDYQDNVSGPEGANSQAALRRLSTLAERPVSETPSNFAAAMVRLMDRIYPQKVAYVGETRLNEVTREGTEIAQRYAFPTVRAQTMVVALMFAFGHGCTRDPLYPWISHTLADEKIVSPAARAERLEKKARTWLDHVIASFPEP